MDKTLQELKLHPVTWGLVIFQSLLFVYLYISSKGAISDAAYMAEIGGMRPDYVLAGRVYVLFTCLFLHYDWNHLLNNMFILLVVGREVEEYFGSICFSLIYIFSGLGGSILSCVHMIISGNWGISAGASGCIFGLLGALVSVILIHRGHFKQYSMKRALIMVALCIYSGFVSESVDAYGHLGGILTGFLLGTILGIALKCIRREKESML